MKTRILYIEDEPHLSRIVRETLEFRGFEVCHVADGKDVLETLPSFDPHICILDVMLPHVDGFTLGRSIRNIRPALPVIFLTARVQTDDVVLGFASGGTDYLKKPFSMEELLARIENQLRISGSARTEDTPPSEWSEFGTFRFSLMRLELEAKDGSRRRLSHREAEVLNFILLRGDEVTDRRELLMAVWGDDSFFNSRTLDVYVRKLRDYLRSDASIELLTLKGKGYRLVTRS